MSIVSIDVVNATAPTGFPELIPEQRQYWTTAGQWDVDPPERGPYRLNPSREDALRWAKSNPPHYRWDGAEPTLWTLSEALAKAHRIGRPGVSIYEWCEFEACWVVVAHYP